jgi:alkylation response protein AidB-like acyl-CoA dehydrogenase
LHLTPDSDDIAIIEVASAFLEDAIPIGRLHGGGPASDLSDEPRRRIAEMGWFGSTLPLGEGGTGLSSVEHVLFFREVGRRCGPLDILVQVLAVLTARDPVARQAFLEGRTHVALVVNEGESRRVFGRRDAPVALHVEAGAAQLYDLSNLEAAERPSLDPATTMRVLQSSLPEPFDVSDDPNILRLARLGGAAMLVGLGEAALDLIVDYAKIRETFGRPIGAYQAVRHPCADMALRIEAARCQLWFAAAAMKDERADMDAHIAAAKHLANEAAVMNADTNIQLHGGIGVTDDHDAHLLLKHALLLSRLFGAKRALFADLLHARVKG